MSKQTKRIQDLPPPTKNWPKPEARQVLAEPAAAATPKSYGPAIRMTEGESGKPCPSQPGGQHDHPPVSKQALKNWRKRVCVRTTIASRNKRLVASSCSGICVFCW